MVGEITLDEADREKRELLDYHNNFYSSNRPKEESDFALESVLAFYDVVDMFLDGSAQS